MKLKLIIITLTCQAIAGWLRMFGTRLTWPNIGYLKEKPFVNYLRALWITGLSEILYFFWAYIIPIGSFIFFYKKLQLNKRNIFLSMVLGMFHGAIGYLLAAIISNTLWRKNELIPLLIIYTLVGIVYGLLYHIYHRINLESNEINLGSSKNN